MSGRRLAHVAFGLYLVVCCLCVVWPGYALFGARIEPFVFGLPFAFAWMVLWVVLTFLALAAYHSALSKWSSEA